MPGMADQHYRLREQYRNADNLEARIALHGGFSTAPIHWFTWGVRSTPDPAACPRARAAHAASPGGNRGPGSIPHHEGLEDVYCSIAPPPYRIGDHARYTTPHLSTFAPTAFAR